MEFREDRRRKAFEENLVLIEQHNEEFHKGHYSFKLSPNSLADLSNTQYMKRYVRLLQRFDPVKDGDYILGDVQYGGQIYPDTLDWRAKGFVTPPSNQKSCGSCYAFSIAHSLEGLNCLKISFLNSFDFPLCQGKFSRRLTNWCNLAHNSWWTVLVITDVVAVC